MPMGLWLLGCVGVLAILWAVSRIIYFELTQEEGRHMAAPRRAHNDADYECVYWWGDRRESIGACCPVCNPKGVNVLGSQDRV